MNKNNILVPLEDIMGTSFGRYSKYIIQDRAIPDARDGLKPVHRRIIYAMYKGNNTFSKPYRKSAKTVGDVIGNYHPHGDSSIYDAMVRMSQTWKLRYPLIDMHGNNGSIDDDPAAAMRYTEARMSYISSLLVSDIEKETVKWSLNFDDTELEPTVLPAKFPNLLVNGTSGIASGYATEIPPHNLSEIMEALIYRINQPQSTIKDIIKIVKGPDFPTGGLLSNVSGIEDAFETGKGRILLRGKTDVSDKKISITEIPFGVYKAQLIREIHSTIITADISGIVDIRDETDRKGLKIVIELEPKTDGQNILNFLYQKTKLQTWYNYNMVSIINKKPILSGIIELLDNYIAHQKQVLTKRLNFTKTKLSEKLHILDGLIIAIDNIDKIISIIRKSTSKSESKENIIKEFNFTDKQVEAIVTLRLYRLSSTNIEDIQEQKEDIEKEIKSIKLILATNNSINKQLIEEFEAIKRELGDKRKTKVKKALETVKFDSKALIKNEQSWLSVTKDGYIKRSTTKSYQSSIHSKLKLNDQDTIILVAKVNTFDNLLVFFSSGKYTAIPIYKIKENKWREKGEHISTLVNPNGNDSIVKAIPITNFFDQSIILGTQLGVIKRINLINIKLQRWTKLSVCIKLKNDDKLIGVNLCDESNFVSFISKEGYANKYLISEIPITKTKTMGVKGISLKNTIIAGFTVFSKGDQLAFITNANQGKRIKESEIPLSSRTTKGTRINKLIKTKPQEIIWFDKVESSSLLQIITQDGVKEVKASEISLLKLGEGNNKFFNNKDFVYSVYLQTKTKSIQPKSNNKTNLKPKKTDQKTEINLFDILDDI